MLNKLMGIAADASEHGFMIDHMLEVVHWFMAVLFVGWTAFFFYAIYRFHRKRHPVADYHGVKSKASTHAEVSVVIIECVLLLGFAFPLWGKRVNEFPSAGQNPVNVRVVGYQFGWLIHYPGADGVFGLQKTSLIDASTASGQLGLDRAGAGKDDIIVRNVLHLPSGRPAILQVTSLDVIHNFAVYTMRVAQDAIPGSQIPMWFTPARTGEWEVICGQLCGAGHAMMKATLVVDSPADYDDWMKQMAALNEG